MRPYTCQTCGDAFEIKKTPDNKHSVVNHECSKCKKLFKAKNSLDYHYKTHDIENQFPWEACGKRFVTKTKLKVHMNTHTGETPYKCLIAGCPEIIKRASKTFGSIPTDDVWENDETNTK